MPRRLFTSLMLIVVAFLVVTPMIHGQNAGTVASIGTQTTTATYTQTSEYATATNSMMVTTTEDVYDKTLTVDARTQGATCWIAETYSFDAKAGQQLTGTFKTDQIATLYIVDSAAYKIWASQNWCSPEGAGTYAVYSKTMDKAGSESVVWNVLRDDTYWIILEAGYVTSATTMSFNLSRVVVESVTSTWMATTSNFVMITATITQTSVGTLTSEQSTKQTSAPEMSQPALVIVAIVVALALIVAATVYVKRSRKQK